MRGKEGRNALDIIRDTSHSMVSRIDRIPRGGLVYPYNPRACIDSTHTAACLRKKRVRVIEGIATRPSGAHIWLRAASEALSPSKQLAQLQLTLERLDASVA
jgi:hypothetical protein